MAATKRKSAQTAQTVPSAQQKDPLVEISEEEQWRIIRDSGILKQANDSQGGEDREVAPGEPLLSPLTEEVFSAMTLIIPHSFLLLMMEMYVFS